MKKKRKKRLPGPKMDMRKTKKVLRFRSKGLSFREIAKLMEVSEPTVFQRYKKAIVRYPQLKLLTK